MSREIMRRRAADNPYLHQDFHGALSAGIEYLHERHGPEAVRRYLRDFARSFYAPLKERLRAEGLAAVRAHYERIFREEGGGAEISGSTDALLIRVVSCPAIAHMRRRGLAVARMFCETTRIVNEILCEGAPFEADLCECDPAAGACLQRFRRVPG